MTESMVERCARAVAQWQGCNFDDLTDGVAAFGEDGLFKQDCRDIARAVIEAMREPTPMMIAAASACDIQAEHSPDAERICWQAMIHAALSQSQSTAGEG